MRGSKLLGFLCAAICVSVAVRRATRQTVERATETFIYRPPWPVRAFADAMVWLDKRVGWPALPLPIGLAVIVGQRVKLREKNLHDTSHLPSIPQAPPQAKPSSYLASRMPDGTFNDLQLPAMGSARSRFGRNVPNEYTYPDSDPDIMTPSPREVSRELLTRDSFVPAPSLNMLAAAWIQFMIKDWVSHGTGDKTNPWRVPLQQRDDWWQDPMLIPRTIADPTRPADAQDAPPTHINIETHWWDASQVYPSDSQLQAAVRTGTGGRLNLTRQGANELLPLPVLSQLAQQPGWWLGLAMMTTLFAREHNAICDRLAAEYPAWSDDELFQRARIVNAALMAKIHTVEWTPAIISHPTTRFAMRANWWGLQGEPLRKVFGRFSASEVISGIPGSTTEHHSAPYSLTEEFVAVYRMHPLIRDDYTFRQAVDDQQIEERSFENITDKYANELMQQISTEDLFYSFGTLYPGALQLHNYPRFLQHFRRPDDVVVDLAAIDVMRTREVGVPRYALFRELLHLRPITSFEELAANPQWARQLRDVYGDRLDRVDLMIGMFAEPKPAGFGFSDTAFRIFILMASRRLKSDRFFTKDFTPEVYSPAGMEWINGNDMRSVLLRNFPGLRPALQGVDNAFAPWAGARA